MRVARAPVGAVTMKARRFRTARRLAPAGLVVAAMAMSACGGGSAFRYVSSSDDAAFFRVPNTWKVFDQEEVLARPSTALGLGSGNGLRFLSVFAATGELDLDRPLQVLAEAEPVPEFQIVDLSPLGGLPYNWPLVKLRSSSEPFGVAWVRELGIEERDTYSRKDLRNEIVPLDELDGSAGQVRLIRPPEGFVRDGGLSGARFAYEVMSAGTGDSFVVDQTGMVDPDHRLVYFFMIGCRSECFEANQSTITQIADSWTVKEPKS
ncbi:MAG: hypothetical protein ACT4OS_08570 [Acidimicrobiales bacterium]